jgi:TolB-like protein
MSNAQGYLILMLFAVFMFIGCGEDSTAPGDPNGPPSGELTYSWSSRFGDADEQRGIDVAVGPSGNVVVTGSFWGSVDFGGGMLVSAGTNDIFVAKFGPGGTHLWSKRFGDATLQDVAYVAVDASGNVIIAGSFYGTLDFGGGALTSAGSTDIFIAKFTPDGMHLWSDRFGGAGPQSGCYPAVDASGNIFLAGRFYGTIDFGGGTLNSGGNDDIFVAKFDSDGTHLWSKRFGDASAQYATDVAVDGSGNVTITGYLDGSADFGGGVLTSAGSVDIFVAQFDADGTHQWSKLFGDSEYQQGNRIACDASGNVIIAGHFEGSVNFGGGTLTEAGQKDAFVAKFGSDGSHMWSKRFGDTFEQSGNGVAVDASGDVVVVGNFGGTVDCGGGELASAGSFDIFIARFSPSGAHLWSESFGAADEQSVFGVAAGASGAAVIIGAFIGEVDFGGGALTSAGLTDIYVSTFEP